MDADEDVALIVGEVEEILFPLAARSGICAF